MSSPFWDERYSTDTYIFGTAPNVFLASQADLIRSGMRALAIADGEGRNGVWLAEQGALCIPSMCRRWRARILKQLELPAPNDQSGWDGATAALAVSDDVNQCSRSNPIGQCSDLSLHGFMQ